MKICIFAETYEPYISGVVTSIKVLTDTLKSMQHEVYIVTINLNSHKFEYDKKNKIIYIPGINSGICGTKISTVYSRKAMDIIKSWDLDVIHSQSEFSMGCFSRIVAKKLNIPIVHTYHTLYEDYVHYVTHGLFNNTSKKLAIKLTKYFCETKCDELIVPTDKIAKLFKDKYGIKQKAHIIPTGINTKKFELNDDIAKNVEKLQKKYKINKDDFIVGSISRIAKEKSLDRLINSMVELVKYSPKIKLVVVGDGPELANLKKLTKELKLDKNVIFTGLVKNDMTPYYYHLFDVMASFSTTETQGLTIIEALASSKPALCINDKSFTEMVTDKYNGFLFEDEEEFIEIVKMLVNNPKKYAELSLNATNSVYKYSKEVFAADVLKVYSQAIEKHKKM